MFSLQRIMGFFILITHKPMRSENLFLSGDHHHVMHHDCDHMACACILSIASDFIV